MKKTASIGLALGQSGETSGKGERKITRQRNEVDEDVKMSATDLDGVEPPAPLTKNFEYAL